MAILTSFTQKINNAYTSVENFGRIQLDRLKNLSANQIENASKTHNFALVIFAAALTGISLHLAATHIPPYLFIGSVIGITLHISKESIKTQITTKFTEKKYTELAVSIISLAIAGWYLKKSFACAFAVAFILDPRSFIPQMPTTPAQP